MITEEDMEDMKSYSKIFELMENEDMRNYLRELSKKELVNCLVKCIEFSLKDGFKDSVTAREELCEKTEEYLISKILLSMGFFIKIYPDYAKEIFYTLLSEETLSQNWGV